MPRTEGHESPIWQNTMCAPHSEWKKPHIKAPHHENFKRKDKEKILGASRRKKKNRLHAKDQKPGWLWIFQEENRQLDDRKQYSEGKLRSHLEFCTQQEQQLSMRRECKHLHTCRVSKKLLPFSGSSWRLYATKMRTRDFNFCTWQARSFGPTLLLKTSKKVDNIILKYP